MVLFGFFFFYGIYFNLKILNVFDNSSLLPHTERCRPKSPIINVPFLSLLSLKHNNCS